MTKKLITINCEGIEARSIAVLVQKASQFSSSVHIEVGTKKINAKSIMGMMSLGLHSGEEITVTVNGEDEAAAVEEIEKFLSGETA